MYPFFKKGNIEIQFIWNTRVIDAKQSCLLHFIFRTHGFSQRMCFILNQIPIFKISFSLMVDVYKICSLYMGIVFFKKASVPSVIYSKHYRNFCF